MCCNGFKSKSLEYAQSQGSFQLRSCKMPSSTGIIRYREKRTEWSVHSWKQVTSCWVWEYTFCPMTREIFTPITPAHLALGRFLFDLPDIEEVPVNDSKTRQRYLYQKRLVNHFWKRWWGEYLHQLSIRLQWNEEQLALRVGYVVLISDDKVSRGKWPMGRVEKLFPGKDGMHSRIEDKERSSV